MLLLLVGSALTAVGENVSLAWDKHSASDLIGYRLYYGRTSGSYSGQIDVGADRTSATVSNLLPDTRYYFVVTARNSQNLESAPSSEISYTVPKSAGTVPSGLVGTAGTDSAMLKWNSFPGAIAYNVKRSKTSGGPYGVIAKVSSPSHTDGGLVLGRTYYYVVSAITSSGETGNSDQVTVSPGSSLAPPPTTSPESPVSAAPIGLKAVSGDTYAALTWTAYPGAIKYNVKRSKTNGSSYSTIATATQPAHVDRGLVVGRTYYYVISAVTSSGETPNSAQVYAKPGTGIVSTSSTTTSPTPTDTTDTADPTDMDTSSTATPSNVTADVGDSEITLKWSAVAGASGYHIKRTKTDGGPYSQIAFVTGTSHTDGGLVNGRTYYYVISAKLSTGEGPDSIQVGGTPAPSISLASLFATHDGPTANSDDNLPQITVRRHDSGDVELTITGPPGNYAVERSADLISWEPLDLVELEDGLATIVDPGSARVSTFYRIVHVR